MFNKFSSRITKNLNIQGLSKRAFHSQYLIIGAGTGGLSVAGQLLVEKVVSDPKQITIIDNAQIHYYQPGFTKLGGGIYNSNSGSLIEYKIPNIASKYNYHDLKAQEIIASQNKVITDKTELTYDNLIIAPGLEVNVAGIPGLEDLLEDNHSNVVSIYKHKYALKTAQKRDSFTGGRALFTQPPAPIKCAGAPQKAMYMMDDAWKRRNLKTDIHFFTPLPQIFGIKYYSDALEVIADKKGLKRHYKTVLCGFKNDKTAQFKNLDSGEITDEHFSFIHVVPPMRAPEILRNSSEIVDGTGFVDIDSTMRHRKYPNVWAIGDCVNLPNAKTAASVFSQAPVLVANLKSNSNTHHYDGYAACPIFMGENKLMLAEFNIYNGSDGKPITEPAETFFKGNQTVPSALFYRLTVLLGSLYNISHSGKWYGKYGFINPISKAGQKEVLVLITLGFLALYWISKKTCGCSSNKKI